MGRRVKIAPITTRNARSKLEERKAPYWRDIQEGFHLGYRKGATGGSWIVRLRSSDRTYTTAAIATADDKLPAISDKAFAAIADGRQERPHVYVLTYPQALKEAHAWLKEAMRPPPASEEGAGYTVSDAITDYLAWYGKHRKAVKEVTRRANIDIVPALGETLVAELTTKEIREWHEALAEAPPRLRRSKAGPQRTREAPTDPEGIRKRRATANKVLTILKAALNKAFADDETDDDTAWRKVKPFRDVETGAVRYLTVAEATRLVNACEPDFRALVRAALYCGARYGELVTMQVRDYNPDGGTVYVRVSKSGKPRHIPLTDEGQAFFAQRCAGRKAADRILLREDGKQWGAGHQNRRLAAACKAARIDPAINFHILRHCFASWLIAAGVSLEVIADALGHADTRITKKHYAHIAPSHVAAEVRAHLPNLGGIEDDNVVEIGRN